MKFTYLIIDIATLAVPLLFSFHRRIRFNKEWKYFLPANLLIALGFILWDIFFTHFGHWKFNPEKVLGIYLFGLPIEEILFFFCIPYACIFTFHCCRKFDFPLNMHNPAILSILALILAIAAGIFYGRMYSLLCFSLAAILLYSLRNAYWMPIAFPVFLLLLLPFFLVNGLLTGMGAEEPVVIYSPAAIIGLRLVSIPIEDIFYALSLFLSNLWLYAKIRSVQAAENLPGL